jgi:hypothetical protein
LVGLTLVLLAVAGYLMLGSLEGAILDLEQVLAFEVRPVEPRVLELETLK